MISLPWRWLPVMLVLGGCMAPPSQAQRVTEVARELNMAARFGRMDVALSHTAKGAREAFLERRGQWGRRLRIVDVELAGLSLSEATKAKVQVDVAWVRVDESQLRNTRVAQVWKDDGGWRLVREKRVAGDLGLFGEKVDVLRPASRDVHFPSRTIR